jgi:hypothetical protein
MEQSNALICVHTSTGAGKMLRLLILRRTGGIRAVGMGGEKDAHSGSAGVRMLRRQADLSVPRSSLLANTSVR